jgi:hypothetical protein
MGDNFEEGRRAHAGVLELIFGHDVTRRADVSRQLASSRGIAWEFLRGGDAGPDQARESQEAE